MNITLKNLQHSAFASQETHCFQATVYIDGKKQGTVENAGHGGSNNYHPPALYEMLAAHAKTLPPLQTEMKNEDGTPYMMEQDPDILIGNLVNDLLEQKALKRHCARKTLFRIPGKAYAEGEWSVLNVAFNDSVKSKLQQQHGLDVVIANEQLGKAK